MVRSRGPAAASLPSQGGGEAIQGVLRTEGTVDGQVERLPLEGITVTVSRAGGAQVGSSTSDADGRWRVEVPQTGSYDVTIDPGTFPEGVSLTEADRTTITTTVNPGQQRGVIFRFGPPAEAGGGLADRTVQLTVEGIRFGLILALASLGLSLIFGTTGLTNFSHGELVTLGALVAFFFNVTLGLPLVVAGILSVVVCGVLGSLQDTLFWRQLRRRGTGLIAMMITSIGVAIFLRYLYLYLYGGDTSAYDTGSAQTSLPLGPVSLTAADAISMAIAVVCLVAVSYALLRTRLGKATRAVADNPALAAASGIDVDRVINVVCGRWARRLAGLAGVLLGIAQQVNYIMGFQILLLVFAAVTLGGLGTAWGALVGSLVVGLFLQLSTLVIPIELQNVGALVVLILVLLVRPQGILGRAQRVG